MTISESITLESIYKEIVSLQRDVALIKKSLVEEPELRESFIAKMRDVDLDESIPVDDFAKRYGIG
jgi:hypothetical protein